MRKIYYAICLMLPITWLVVGIRGGDVKTLMLWTSLSMVVAGGIVISAYDGPQRSALSAFFIGKPPAIARFFVAIYGAMSLGTAMLLFLK
jgi:hypothetical protein